MALVRHLLSAFFAGELDPLTEGRVDTEQHANGLALCENFVPINEGPLVKRPGFEFICDAADTAAWLGAFRYSITQEYVIEWSEHAARFFTNGGRIETGPGVPYQVVTPYAAADAARLSTQQSYDRLYIDHAGYAPAALTRTSAVTFVHANSVLKDGPFADDNTDETITVGASGVSGSGVTLTASSPIFLAGHVGSPVRLEAADFSTLKVWEPGMQAVAAGEIVRSDGKAYQAATSGVTGTVQPTHTSGSEWDGQGKKDELNVKGPYGVQWTYLHDRFGIATITAIGGGGTTATVDVDRRLPNSVTTTPSFRWALGAFSAAAGWPSLVTHWKGRQIHVKEFDVIGSVVGDFGGGTVNFSTHTDAGVLAPDMAFRRAIATEDPPLWIAPDRKALLVGTASKELAISPLNPQAILSGDNIDADPQSFYGSEAVFPVQIGTQALFVERGGRRLRSADYNFGKDRYTADDLTAAARHVTAGGLVQLAFQRSPYALVYAVRGDGQLVVHPNSMMEVKGFARTVLGGDAKALSAVSVVGADGKTDELWALVERTRDDGVKREIWRQTPWRELGDAQEAAFFVDAGVQAAATAGQAHFTGALHLANSEVAVLANGGVIPGITVAADGSFDLPAASVPTTDYTLVVGLPYTATAITRRPEIQVRGQTSQGLKQRVVKAALRVLDTLGVKVGGRTGPLEEPIQRPGNAPMDRAIPLFSGATEGLIEEAYGRDGQTRFVSDKPLPAIITAAMLNIDLDTADV